MNQAENNFECLESIIKVEAEEFQTVQADKNSKAGAKK